MDENMAFFMDKLKELVPFAKEREQELTSDMISDFFGHMPLTEEQMEKIYDYLESNGIFVDRSNDEPDRRMLDEAEEEIDPNDSSAFTDCSKQSIILLDENKKEIPLQKNVHMMCEKLAEGCGNIVLTFDA